MDNDRFTEETRRTSTKETHCTNSTAPQNSYLIGNDRVTFIRDNVPNAPSMLNAFHPKIYIAMDQLYDKYPIKTVHSAPALAAIS